MLQTIIPGPPVPKGRPRLGKNGRIYTPERTRQWEAWVHVFIRANYQLPPLDKENEYAVDARFYLKTKRRIDGDNILKALLDGLTGVLWVDDKQVVEAHYVVIRGDKEPRTELTVYGREEEREP